MPKRKTCKKCKKPKPLGRFSEFKRSDRGGRTYRSSACKECVNAYSKQRYRADPSRALKENYENRKRLAAQVDTLKRKPCADCGEQYEPFCMDFDHTGEKTSAISKMIHETASFEAICKEIENTELVCVLCHKTRTYLRRLKGEKPRETPTQARSKAIAILAKSAPCTDCKTKRPYWQMEFDHLRDKRSNVSTMICSNYSSEAVQQEIDKCEVVCALCHRRRTFKQRGYRKMSDKFKESIEKFKKGKKPKKHKRGALIPPNSDAPTKAVDAGPDVKPEDYAHSKRPNKRRK